MSTTDVSQNEIVTTEEQPQQEPEEVSQNTDGPENPPIVEVDETQEEPMAEDEEISKDAIWIVSVMGSVLPKITTANETFTEASNAGAMLDIVTAESGYKESLATYKEALEMLNQIDTPEDPQLINSDRELRLSVEKQTKGIEMALSGLQTFDADILESAAKVYDEGSGHITKAAEYMDAYTASQ